MLKIIEREIVSKSSKMLTYADFISLALYEPNFGYYMVDREKVGKKGDFITSSNIHHVYGKTIAKWYAKLVNQHLIEAEVCEIGAGNGRFAQAFIEEWQKHCEQPLRYHIVETSPYHRQLQKSILPSVNQVETVADLSPFSGLIFSNELFDALPVHVIEKKNGQLFEVMIGMEEQQLVEKLVPLQDDSIYTFLEKNQLKLVDGQRMEIPLEMERLITMIANTITHGLVVTVDYGYTNREWMEPSRRKGSLRGYRQHQLIENVLETPGEMDITSHVHFDALINKGEELNLQFISKQRQDEFLLAAGVLDELQAHVDPNPFSEVSKRNRAIRSLIFPDGISTFFHVIIQKKGLSLSLKQLF